MTSALVALVAFSGCGKNSSEWANNDDDVLAMQREVRAAQEKWGAAAGACAGALAELAKAVERARVPALTSWPTSKTVCWDTSRRDCHPDVVKHLELASPCGDVGVFPEIMPAQVRTKDKATVLAAARDKLAQVAKAMPPTAPVLDAIFVQHCAPTDKLGDMESRFTELGDKVGGQGGFVRCDLYLATLDAGHSATALAYATATSVVKPKGEAGDIGFTPAAIEAATEAATKESLDEAAGKLVATLGTR